MELSSDGWIPCGGTSSPKFKIWAHLSEFISGLFGAIFFSGT
jgi:hypothetical protein